MFNPTHERRPRSRSPTRRPSISRDRPAGEGGDTDHARARWSPLHLPAWLARRRRVWTRAPAPFDQSVTWLMKGRGTGPTPCIDCPPR